MWCIFALHCILFIVSFCLGKYSFSLDTFSKHLVFWRKINIPFIVSFCLGKYSFSLDTFSKHLVFWRKLTFHSLFVSVLANTAYVFHAFWVHFIFCLYVAGFFWGFFYSFESIYLNLDWKIVCCCLHGKVSYFLEMEIKKSKIPFLN